MVEVVDGSTGAPVDGATGTVEDGAFQDPLQPAGAPNLLAGAYERPGTYTVTVTALGYGAWTRTNVVVTADICHVRTVSLRAELQTFP